MTKKKVLQIAGTTLAGVALLAGVAFAGAQQYSNSSGTQEVSKVSGVNTPLDAKSVSTNKQEQDSVTLHFKWSGSQPHVAYTNEKTGESTTKPGVPMKEEGNGWYSCTIPDADSMKMSISVPEVDYQTTEFTREEGEYWYDLDSGWYTEAPENYTEPEEEVVMGESSVVSTGNIVLHYPMSEMEDAKIYYWNVLPKDMEVTWPGEEMAYDDSWYTFSFNGCTKANFLFVNEKEQTEDFTLRGEGEYWYSDGKWVTTKPGTTPSNTDTPTETPVVSKKPTSTATPSEKSDFRDETIYFVMTTRFYDGDSSNNTYCWDDNPTDFTNNDPGWRGDFKGLAEKLDYIKALGFSAVWITPVVQNTSGVDYHGYHANNFKKVDARYESSDYTYQDLINDAHAKGMKIIQDIVLNHTGNFGEENLYPLLEKDNTADLSSAEECMKISDKAVAKGLMPSQEEYDAALPAKQYQYRLDALKKDDMDTELIYHHETSFQWESHLEQCSSIAGDCVDLNTENEIVSDYLIDAYNGYIDMGVDAFRVDTVKHISRLSFNQEFLPAFKEKGGENFFIFGEVCSKVADKSNKGIPSLSTYFYTWKESKTYAWGSLEERMASAEQHYVDYASESAPDAMRTSDNAFLLNDNEYHTPDYSMASGMNVIDFRMHHCFGDAYEAFNASKESESDVFNDATWNVTYVDSHDYGPNSCLDYRYTGGTEAWAQNLDLMFTFRGIPCLYYGSEIEFKAGELVDPHFNSNTKRPYEESGRAYFGDHIEGSVDVTDYGVYNNATGAMATTLNKPLAKHIQRLNLIRRAVPALRKGQFSTQNVDGSGISFRRRYTADNEDSYVLVNLFGSATFKNVLKGEYVELITGKSVSVTDGTLTTEKVGSGNMRVYVLQNDTARRDGATGKIGEDGTYLK